MNLFENWAKTKEYLQEGVDSKLQPVMDQLMENAKAEARTLMESASAGATAANAIGNFQKIAIPMIRRIIPNTIATELVGVQALEGPVGLVYSLRYKYSETVNTGNALTNITGGTTELFGNNSKTKQFYTGGVDGSGVATGLGATTSDFEGYGGRQLQMEILKQTVNVQTRRLQSVWTQESAQDVKSQHNLNVEQEMAAAMAKLIVSEIDYEIISDLQALAGTVATYDMTSTFTGVPHWVGDRHAVLGSLINQVANEIGRKTRMGAANWIVVSPLVVSVLQNASKSVWVNAVKGDFDAPTGTKLVGTLNGNIKVYTYLYFDQGSEPILLGYKGGNGQMETGYFYCPYVPVQASQVLTDPTTLQHKMALMTRYGKATFTDTTTSLGQSGDFYGRLNIPAGTLTFQ